MKGQSILLHHQTHSVRAVFWEKNCLNLLDQTELPAEERYIQLNSTDQVIEAIKKLVVRGAPAIGIAGAYGSVVAALEAQRVVSSNQQSYFENKLKALEMARPTAVNLSWAITKMRSVFESSNKTFDTDLIENLLAEAERIHKEDIDSNLKMATLGGHLLGAGAVLTICNTGSLATGGVGTAYGMLAEGYKMGKVTLVFACETRPVLQGIRLTAWELNRARIPYRIICDNMAGTLMAREKITAVIAGADRISANGDVANKIGTYSLAVLAKAHNIPFYVVAPTSTFDLNLMSGADIPLEERDASEVLSVLQGKTPKFDIPVWNPAFDLTPNSLISAIICERGVINSPNRERIAETLKAK